MGSSTLLCAPFGSIESRGRVTPTFNVIPVSIGSEMNRSLPPVGNLIDRGVSPRLLMPPALIEGEREGPVGKLIYLVVDQIGRVG